MFVRVSEARMFTIEKAGSRQVYVREGRDPRPRGEVFVREGRLTNSPWCVRLHSASELPAALCGPSRGRTLTDPLLMLSTRRRGASCCGG